MESVKEYINETANAVGDFFGGAAGEKEHQAKSEGYKQKRDMEWEKAKDSDETMSERASGVKEAAKNQMNKTSEDADMKKDEMKKENAKDRLSGNDTKNDETIMDSVKEYVSDTVNTMGDFFGGVAGEAKHKTKAEGYKEKRDMEWEKAKDSDETMSERAAGAKNAAKHQVNSMTEQAQKKKDETKKENAKADMDGQTVTEKITNYVDDKLEAAKDWMNSTTEEAEAKAKEEGHKASREKNWEQAKEEKDISKGAEAAKQGAKEMKEGAKKEYHKEKAKDAKHEISPNDASLLY